MHTNTKPNGKINNKGGLMYKVGDIIEGCHSSTKGIERRIVSVDANSLDDKGNKVTTYWWCYPDVLGKVFWSGCGPDIELNIFWRLKGG